MVVKQSNMATEVKKIISRRDTAANWQSNNPVLANGEIGVDTTNKEMKIGDGATPWGSLPSELSKAKTSSSAILAEVMNGSSVEDTAVDLSSVSEKKGSLGGSGWYIDTSAGSSHKVIEVSEKFGSISFAADKESYLGFLTEYTTPYYGAPIPYVHGTSRISVHAGRSEIAIPAGTNYIVFTTVDGAGVRITFTDVVLYKREGIMPQLQRATDQSKDAYNFLVGTEVPTNTIDLSSVSEKKGSLGGSGWYISTSAGSSHKVIEVGTEFGTISLISDKISYIGFLRTYSAPTKLGDPVDYVGGGSRTTVYPGTNTFAIPVGTNYIVFTTVDGGGVRITFTDVVLSKREGLIDNFNELANDVREKEGWNFTTSSVFSVMSYNIGGWYNGSGTSIPADKQDIYEPLNKSILRRYAPDVIMLQEFRDYVVGSNRPYTYMLGGYTVYKDKGDTSYMGKAIASRYTMEGVESVIYRSDSERNYTKGYLYVNGRRVLFVNTHLALTEQAASAQIDELLALAANEEYVVIGMDSNLDIKKPSAKAIMDKFSTAGMRYLNTDKTTYPIDDEVIDNIIVTNNIALKSLIVDTKKESLGADADHYPIIAYLEIF